MLSLKDSTFFGSDRHYVLGRKRKPIAPFIFLALSLIACACGAFFVISNEHQQATLQACADEFVQKDGRVNIKALSQKYKDTTSWIKVEGAKINLPVVQAQENDPEFYLTHAIDGSFSSNGVPFIDARSSATAQNTLIYAHRSYPDTMFSNLSGCYKQELFDKRCASKGATLQVEGVQYQARALCALKVNKSFQDIQRFHFKDKDEFHAWLKSLVNKSQAKAEGTDELIESATKAISCATCTGMVGGPTRTLVIFVS